MQIEAGSYSSAGRTRTRHRKKSIFGITFGVLLVMGGAVGGYYTFSAEETAKGARFVLLMLPGLAIALWGCTHLARHRGYPSFAAFLLFLTGLFVMALIPGAKTPFTIGFAIVFATLFPTVVLLAMPVKKDNRKHRRRRSDSGNY